MISEESLKLGRGSGNGEEKQNARESSGALWGLMAFCIQNVIKREVSRMVPRVWSGSWAESSTIHRARGWGGEEICLLRSTEFKEPKEQSREVGASHTPWLSLSWLRSSHCPWLLVRECRGGRRRGACGNSQHPREVSINPPVEIISKIWPDV